MHLTGTRRHSVDAKLRLKLPVDYRREFGNQVCLLPMEGALQGFTPEGHEAFVEQCFPEGFNPLDKGHRALRRRLNASTVTVDIDSAGRICLNKVPDAVRPDLGEERQVVLVGNEDHFEIWSPDAWEEQQEKMDDLAQFLFE